MTEGRMHRMVPRLTRAAISGDNQQCAQPNKDVDLQDIYDKLYCYEQADEEGLILKLPVPIGTEVYSLKKSCNSLPRQACLTQQSLEIECPFYDPTFCRCKKHEINLTSAFESEDYSPINKMSIEDDACVKRIYVDSKIFTYSDIPAFQTMKLANQLFVSPEHAIHFLASLLSVSTKEQENMRKPRYF